MVEAILHVIFDLFVGSIGAFVLWIVTGKKGSYSDYHHDNERKSVIVGILVLALVLYFIARSIKYLFYF